MNTLSLSWKNLKDKPLSMLLSLVLFALGVGLVALLLLLNKQIQDKFDKNLAGIDLVVGAKGSPLQLILSSMYHIDNPTGNISVKEIRPFLNPKHPLIKQSIPLSLGDSYKGYRIVGTAPSFLDLYNGELAVGQLWKNDFEVVLGAAVADEHNLQLGDQFHSSHGFVMDDNLIHDDSEQFKVAGILKPGGSVMDQLILTNTQSIWKVHDHDHSHEEGATEDHSHDGHDHDEDEAHHDHAGHDHDDHDHNHDDHDHDHAKHTDEPKPLIEELDKEITSLLVQFKHRNYQALNMQRSINENTDMQAATPAIEINRLYSMMGVGTDALWQLALVIIFVSGLSIFIALFNSLRDRKYELALMRVMGASKMTLFLLIIFEGLILAFIGYVLGILLSHLGMELFSTYLKDAYRYSFTGALFLKEEIFLLLAALAIGFVAALLPALQAFRTDISTTLAKN